MQGIGNIRVVIEPDGSSWFAQGLEVDYGAQGETIEDAKRNFEEGLSKTFKLNSREKGHLRDIFGLEPPRDMWPSLVQCEFKKESQLSTSITPFEGLDYYIFETERDTC